MEAKDWERMRIYAEENGLMNEDLGKVANDFREHMRRGGLNKHVPDKVIHAMQEQTIKRLEAQIGKLKQENHNLQQKNDNLRKGIEAFKKWQAKLADYKFGYWLTEGIKLAHERIKGDPTLPILRKFMGHCDTYDRRMNQLLKTHNKMITECIKLLEQEQNVETILNDIQNEEITNEK